MLQISNISKVYKTGNITQRALDGVSLSLRDNEFVAILGPSGSGKTTLLNIIGGLDRYDSGDLVINGVSTKKYKDRDWDSYRNHTIGFVFQSYNLIPHQTVLSNVELALTISGISGSERRRRAEEALRKVGLGDQMHKKPNQMSGGQMQRVAIARALVNDPDIVLADEPTGALDSETSVQVMDLLKEVAKDRLVVMVTHNPDLAEQYATRIVHISDGRIISDSQPFVPAGSAAPPVHRNLGRASMSFLTALQLSFNNLKTKKARTFLVAFAGSIGIIGIALIMSLSNGVNKYIEDTERETLSEYPLTITKAGMDLSSLMESMTGSSSDDDKDDKKEEQEQKEEIEVKVYDTISKMYSEVSINDLKSLKSFLESGKSDINTYARAIEYTYNIAPHIYVLDDDDAERYESGGQKAKSEEKTEEKSEKKTKEKPEEVTYSYKQVNPSRMGGSNMFASMMGSTGTSSFFELPKDTDLYIEQYDVKAGRWPEDDHELVIVLGQSGGISDMTLYALGLRDPEELIAMMKAIQKSETYETDTSYPDNYTYDDFIGLTCKLVNSTDCYEYDKEYKLWKAKNDDKEYMQKLAESSEDLTVVGVVQPKEGQDVTMLQMGVGYPRELTKTIMLRAAGTDIVKEQLANPDLNVFTGKEFGADTGDTFKMEDLFTVDEDAIADAFKVDTSALSMDNIDMSSMADLGNMDFGNLDIGSMIDMQSLAQSMPSFSEADLANAMSGITVDFSQEKMTALFTQLIAGYSAYSAQNPSTDYSKLGEYVREYLQSDAARQLILDQIRSIIAENSENLVTREQLEAVMTQIVTGYPVFVEANELDPEDTATNITLYMASEEVQTLLETTRQEIIAGFENMAITQEQAQRMATAIYEGYNAYAQENGGPDLSQMLTSFSDYMNTDEARGMLMGAVRGMVNTDGLAANFTALMSSAMTGFTNNLTAQISAAIQTVMNQVASQLQSTMTAAMSNVMTQMSENMEGMFDVDPDAFANIIKTNMTTEEMSELFASLMSDTSTSDQAGNLAALGYAEETDPYSILIYPTDFDSKNEVVAILDGYNSDMKEAGEEDKVITYSDIVGTMMSSVTHIINMISYVLIAFVAISLVVSSIMIGVITYISVLERRKEIGILRAIGASKGNVAQVFNAETFITGLLAGVIGIAVTLALLVPANKIIHTIAEDTSVNAVLPAGGGAFLIVLSVILTLIAGLFPAHKASKSDPVTALRSE